MNTIAAKDLIGQSSTKESDENVQQFGARVFRFSAVTDKKNELKDESEYTNLICDIPNWPVYETHAYNQIPEYSERDNNDI